MKIERECVCVYLCIHVWRKCACWGFGAAILCVCVCVCVSVHKWCSSSMVTYNHTCIHAYIPGDARQAWLPKTIYAYLHTYTHTYIHTRWCSYSEYKERLHEIHTYIHTYIHAYIHTCIHTRWCLWSAYIANTRKDYTKFKGEKTCVKFEKKKCAIGRSRFQGVYLCFLYVCMYIYVRKGVCHKKRAGSKGVLLETQNRAPQQSRLLRSNMLRKYAGLSPVLGEQAPKVCTFM
jgi:hypothetical protein